MRNLALTVGIAAATIAASLAYAGPGYGPGTGPGCAAGTTTGCQGGMGPGMGMGMGGGHGRGQGAGLDLMTPEERTAHRTQMQSLKTVEECTAYLSLHHAAMAARAAEKGVTLPEPRANACQRMQARGRFG